MNSFAIRGALAVLALLVVVWLGFGVRGVRLESDADAVLARAQSGPLAPATVNTALDDYAKAARLSPDQTPLIHQGELLESVGRRAEAHGVAVRATDAEPDNLQAWFLRWAVADPKSLEKKLAKRRVLDLNPWFLYALTGRSPHW